MRRELGLRGAAALGIGGTVGGGVYVLVGTAAGAAGPAALVAFGFAFLASLVIALPYAELACRYPLAGGGYASARAVFGPHVGFLMGWGFWGAYLFISGYVTLGFGGYLQAVTGIPQLTGRDGLMPRTLALLGARTGAPWAALACSAILLAAVALTRSVSLVASVGGFLYVLHFVVPLGALVALRRRGVGAPAFRTPAPWLVLPLAFLACAVLLFASGSVGAGGGLAWLALGAVGYAGKRQSERVANGEAGR